MEQGDTAATESRALTGLRGMAAMLVMLHHFYLNLALDQHMPLLQWLLRKGYLGVDLFFVLSGFVMAMAYGAWFAGSRPASVWTYARFMVRRVARLWPLHATVLLVLLLLVPQIHASTRLIIANVAMIQSWGISATMNAPSWSVSTELLAYVLFPALAWLALKDRPGLLGPALCLAGIVAALAICMVAAPPLGPIRRGRLDIHFNDSPLPALRCLAGFTLGMLAWRAGQLAPIRAVASHSWTGPLAVAVFIGMLLGRVNDLLIYPLLPVIVLGMHHGSGRAWRLFAAGPLHRLGVLSYAIYLIHYALLIQFPLGWAPLPVTLCVFLVITLGLAILAHTLVERPGRHLLRSIGDAVIDASERILRRPAAAPLLPPAPGPLDLP